MGSVYFKLSRNTEIQGEPACMTKPVELAVRRMKRDMDLVLTSGEEKTMIRLEQALMGKEEYVISFPEAETSAEVMVVTAGGDLGFVYGFLYLSREYLNRTPFWFWNDQKTEQKESVLIPADTVRSTEAFIKYRGWFINDEVLISTWKGAEGNDQVWEMVFESLLRLGGNMVIPGTDKNSRLHRQLAADMGLYISHHHAEPLGAEMFSRAFPELTPSFHTYPQHFITLWEEAVREQKDYNVIWNLGFRGQGDYPFWKNDKQYETLEARGELISHVMELQAELVRRQVKEPVFCTNLYGEIMELYTKGYLRLPENTIRVRGDNGYGKMVSRRQGLDNPRISSLPDEKEQKEQLKQGIYYHVSFYDLQAANHITMQPNSLEFVRKELKEAFASGVTDYLIVNCSNVKPHVYYLEAVAKLWKQGEVNLESYKEEYVKSYYGVSDPVGLKEITGCFDDYAKAVIPYGTQEDEHAGEQFYNYLVRGFCHYFMQGKTEACVKELSWATGDIGFKHQIQWFLEKCEPALTRFEALKERCERVKKFMQDGVLWQDSMELQVTLHLLCIKGSVFFCKACEAFTAEDYQKSFYLMGNAAQQFQNADHAMRQREHHKWNGFYANECLTDVKQTGYLLKHLMGYIRNMGEGPHFYSWQREFLYSETDRKVMLITNFENHLTDEELYEYMKKKWDKQ